MIRPFLFALLPFLTLSAWQGDLWVRGDRGPERAFDPFCSTHDCVWDQTDEYYDTHDTSQKFAPGGTVLDSYLADDFLVPAATCWQLNGLFVKGKYQFFTPTAPAASMNVTVYADNAGLPGTPLKNWPSAAVITETLGASDYNTIHAALQPALVLPSGHYWICVQLNAPDSQGIWFWSERATLAVLPDASTSYAAAWQNPGGGWGVAACTSWGARKATCNIGDQPDNVYALTGWDWADAPDAVSLAACQGDSVALTTTEVEGASYAWTGPNGFSSSDREPLISASALPSHSGTYEVVVTVGSCSSPPQSTVLTVHSSAPVDISSNLPVCDGGTLNLSTAELSGASYAWTGPNSFSSSLRNPVVTTNASSAHEGDYHLVVTVDGCATDQATLNVVIGVGSGPDDPPTASANTPCMGGTLNLSAEEFSGATYSWIGPQGQTSSDREPQFAPVDSGHLGTWQVSYSISGCSSPFGSVVVSAKPLPSVPLVSNDGPVCLNGTLTLSASGTPGSTFHWSGPNGFSASGASVVVDPFGTAQQGTYTCQAELDGCFSTATGTTTPQALDFQAVLPPSQAQGLAVISLLAQSSCPQGPVSYEWFLDESNTSFGVGVNPIALDPPLLAPVRYRIEQSDTFTSLLHRLTVLAHPSAYDINGDSVNSLADLQLVLPEWPSLVTSHDFDGNGTFDVRDMMYIRPNP